MPLTHFLAQIVGIYLLIVGVSMLFQKKYFMQVVNEMAESPAMLYTLGFIALLLGLMVILSHNIWTGGTLPLIVTLMGWVMFSKGLFVMFTPAKMMQRLIRLMKLEELIGIYVIILFALGSYLTYAGFMG